MAFLRRFRRDESGNVLILTAAILLPLLAMVGSGIDIARIHVTNSRLQQACDAASLAGRWAVSAGNSTDQVSAEAIKYFNFNFPQQTYDTTAFTPVVSLSGGSTKIVTITASTTLPMTIMKIWGSKSQTMSVTCSAKQDFVNTDIVLVLDTTGSMADRASSSDSQSKIQALRSAVLALYDQLKPIQDQLATGGMRLRYGIVPYSATVNVGKLIVGSNFEHVNYMLDPAPYQQCQSRDSNGKCTSYKPVNVSHASASFYNSWPGCIEERATNSSITASTTSIPADAYDLDLDLIPYSTATRWPPYDPDAQQAENASVCPATAARLKTWDRDSLVSYLNGLTPSGATYHDIGMTWGGRLISANGVFADSPTTYNNMPVNKFIIFMTDGELNTTLDTYSAYGVERYDKRVTAGDLNSQRSRHQQRFSLMCSRVKNAGSSIWVVAFASALDQKLVNCATNAGQASTSANSADLIAKFREIGKNIGALRLTE